MKGKAFLRALLVAILVNFLAFLLIVRSSYAETGTAISIEPAVSVIHVGEEFRVNITIRDMVSPGLFSYELKLYYDKDRLIVTSASFPPNHFLEMKGVIVIPPGPYQYYFNFDAGYVCIAATLLYPEPGRTGSGVLATVTFKGIAEGLATLQLKDVILVDPNFSLIPQVNYDVNDAYVRLIAPSATDLDGNGRVDIADLTIVAVAFGSKPGEPNWNPDADLDKNNIVNVVDIAIVAKNFGKNV